MHKLVVEQTKSRPRHSNDNGLVETKNEAVIRKLMGYGHIAARHAEAIGLFFQEHLNPYLHFHRPCGLPETIVNAKRQTAQDLSLVCNAVGDSAPVAGFGATSAARNFHRCVGTKSGCSKRHTGRRQHAGSQAQAVREDISQADRLSVATA